MKYMIEVNGCAIAGNILLDDREQAVKVAAQISAKTGQECDIHVAKDGYKWAPTSFGKHVIVYALDAIDELEA